MPSASGGYAFSPDDHGSRFAVLDRMGIEGEPKNKRKLTIKTRKEIESNDYAEFFVMEHSDEKCDLKKVSPFLIEKAISIAVSDGWDIQRTRDGKLLIIIDKLINKIKKAYGNAYIGKHRER